MNLEFDSWGEQFRAIKETEEIRLASNYIASINNNESIAEQEMKYWLFRNYSVENNGDRELRCEIYEIHTKEFIKQMREMK